LNDELSKLWLLKDEEAEEVIYSQIYELIDLYNSKLMNS